MTASRTPDGSFFGTIKGKICNARFLCRPLYQSPAPSGMVPPGPAERESLSSKSEVRSYISCSQSHSHYPSSRSFYRSMDLVKGVPSSGWPGGHWVPMPYPVAFGNSGGFEPISRSYSKNSYLVALEWRAHLPTR